MKCGHDVLGGVKYPKQVSAIPVEYGIGIFWDTFGPAKSLIQKEAKKRPFIRVQGIWQDNHNFGTSNEPKAIAIGKELQKIAIDNPGCEIYYSPYCEHKQSSTYMQSLFSKIKPHCPNVTLVNCPLPQGGILPMELNETHGGGKPRSPKYAFSFDGTAAEDSDVETIKDNFKNAEYFMLWGPRYNGRWESNDTTPRPQRKGWPDAKYIKSLSYLITDKGVTSVPKKWLWKSHSENKGNGDPRAEKPVAIIGIKAKEIVLKKENQKVGVMKYFGTFSGGLYRYYATQWGYEIGKVDLWVNGKKVSSVNAGFRDPTFRN